MINNQSGILFSEDFKKVNHIAQAIAKEHMHPNISTPHLLLALIHRDAGLYSLLKQMQKDIYYLEEWAEVRMETITKATRLDETLVADMQVKAVIEEADIIRLMAGREKLEPLHVLAAISTPGVGFSYDQLKTWPLQRQELVQQAINGNVGGFKNGNGCDYNSDLPDENTQAIAKYCACLNEQAKRDRFDPIVGRDREVRAMCEILGRRSKPNVLIIGEPGVGKTALVNGFVQAIVQERVPEFLKQAQVFELNNGSLAAGACYKGEVEERLKNIIREIKQFEKAILFIDELHVLIDKQGAMAGAANMLKPELARGEITVIGATTIEDYRRYIEKDEALARRFDIIQMEEPDAITAFRMLKLVMPGYTGHHHIEICDENLHEAIRLARRYIHNRRLPDAAIDLVDHSMAALRLVQDTGEKLVTAMKEQFESQLSTVELYSSDDWKWHYQQLSNKISPVLWAAITSEADPMKMESVEEITGYLQAVYEVLAKAAMEHRSTLHNTDLAAVVAYKTGIPIGRVQAQEKDRLLKMEAILRRRVVGQDHAIRSISEAILESRAGLGKDGQPIGSFFFLGPTGTGKTELAKALAAFLFQDESAMIRFDMSEFKEEHAAALLYGAPPGYIGYEQGGLLINKIREQPYSVVLFDEIEKAHASVFDIFLQIMDEGKLHDKLGRQGDFSNALIIFTSNIGSEHVTASFHNDQIPLSAGLMEIMSKYFRPEFLGRLTEILPFAPMTDRMVKSILDIQLRELHAVLKQQGVDLHVSDAAKKQLIQIGYMPQYGARPLAGAVRNHVRRPLSKKIITEDIHTGNAASWELDIDDHSAFVWRAKN